MKLEQIEKKAKEVKEAYDYMDTMPLEGWFWEVIRRSFDYRSRYQELFTLCANDEKPPRNVILDQIKKIEELGLKIPSGILDGEGRNDEGLEWKGVNGPDRYNELMEMNYLLIKPNDEYCGPVFFNAVPRPEVKFCNFESWQKPDISCKAAQCIPYEKFLVAMVQDPPIPLYDVLKTISLGEDAEDSIFIVVSKSAPFNQIEQEIQEILREHVVPRKTRIRTNKWKLYLITYDLQQARHSESEIGYILTEAFPPEKQKDMETYDKQTAVNYYKNAVSLLSGEYKKFLIIPK